METKYIDNFIETLHDALISQSKLIKNDVRIKTKIRDRLWSAIFLLEENEVSIGVTKNGITYSCPEFNEKGEEPVCTIKEFLVREIDEGRITLLELEKLIFKTI
jgi:hypothetical protein